MSTIKEQIKEVVEKNNFFGLREGLNKIAGEKNVDFAFSPVAHYSVKYEGKTIYIANKNAVDIDSDTLVVGEIAIG